MSVEYIAIGPVSNILISLKVFMCVVWRYTRTITYCSKNPPSYYESAIIWFPRRGIFWLNAG